MASYIAPDPWPTGSCVVVVKNQYPGGVGADEDVTTNTPSGNPEWPMPECST